MKDQTRILGNFYFSLKCHNIAQSSKLCNLGVFWNPQDFLLKMATEIFKIDASWAEKLSKARVSFLMAPTVSGASRAQGCVIFSNCNLLLLSLLSYLKITNLKSHLHNSKQSEGSSILAAFIIVHGLSNITL